MQVRELDLNKKASPEIYGRECAGCRCDLDWIHYRKDSSQRDGYAVLCYSCEHTEKLSVNEHVYRQREGNYAAASAQRARHQDDYRGDYETRKGRQMLHSDFLTVLQQLVPSLYITEGRIIGDLAVFRTFPTGQERLEGRSFEYLFYIPTGILPEFSIWEFDEIRNVRVKESRRGWRTILLRLIKLGLLTEEICDRVFGKPSDVKAATVWKRELWEYRNQQLD